MKDIVISTCIILGLALGATAMSHVAGQISRQVAAFGQHPSASPAAFVLHGALQKLGVTWL